MSHGSAGEEPILDFDDAISGPDESTVVGDDDERAVAAPLLLADEREDLVAPFSVEVASRLVGEEDDRVLDQGPRDRHPLLLAPRELRRPVTQPVAEPDLLQEAPRLSRDIPV